MDKFDKLSLDTIGVHINLMAKEVARVESDHGFWDQDKWNGLHSTMERAHPIEGPTVTIPLETYRRLVIMEKIALCHAELSEFVEVMRKDSDKKSEKTPDHAAGAEELADAIIRILGVCKRLGYNIGKAVVDKNNYNITRPYKHGKRF